MASAQSSATYASIAEGEAGDEGIGMAEVIAIVVCAIIICAFCLVCYIMVRNANKRKRMAEEKAREPQQLVAVKKSKTRGHYTQNGQFVTTTGQIKSRRATAATPQVESSEEVSDSEMDSSEYAD